MWTLLPRGMLQSIMDGNWTGEKTREAGRTIMWNEHKRIYVGNSWVWQSAVGSGVSFCRDYFGAVNLFISNCVRYDTSQDAVFPLSCWHTWQLLLHRCSLFSGSLMIPFWRRRAGLHSWSTGRAIGRHTWRWQLQWERQCDSPQCFKVWFYLTCPQSSEHFGGNERECWNKGNDPTVAEWSDLGIREERALVSQ